MVTDYKRITLKLSGEALTGSKDFGIDPAFTKRIAEDIAESCAFGLEMSIVIGGGNIYRGMKSKRDGIDRLTGDCIGMLATVINSLALQSFLEDQGVETRVMSAFPIHNLCEPYIFRKARRHLEKKRVVICAAGTGNPYFSTDTAAVLRAAELSSEVLVKATNVDGIYEQDPQLYKEAKYLKNLSYQQALSEDLKVMDGASFALARDSNIPIIVFSLTEKGNLAKAIKHEGKFSYVGK